MGERGRDEEGEDKGCERPEWPVEIGRGREVGRRIRRREGIEGVDASKEYLKRGEFSSPRVGREGRREFIERELTVFVSTSKWC